MSKNYTVLKNGAYYMDESKRIIFECERMNNDYNGNPRYKLTPINFMTIEKLDTVSRNMYKGGYYIVQSYNIVQDVARMFNELLEKDTFKNMPVYDDELLKDYQKVNAFY